MMPISPYCEGPFSRICNRFSGEENVYTEDAGGSSPSSPTIFSNDLEETCEEFDGIVEPRTPFCYV